MFKGGGVYRGSSVLVTGSAGTGKSSLAASFIAAACKRGERAVMFVYEESEDQVLRNMRSIGIDLGKYIKKGLLQIHASRPTLQGLEQHLVTMYDVINDFDPQAVVVDPMTDMGGHAEDYDVRPTLIRLVDFMKRRGITTCFTSLISGTGNVQQEGPQVNVSSLMDTWILLRNTRAVLPLVADDTVIALLVVGASRACDTSLPASVARAAALALRNARLHGEALRALGEARPEPPRPPSVSPAPLGDIASLLAVVLGRLAAVRERLVDPDAARELAVAEEAAWRIAESLRRLLGFAPSAAVHVAAPLDLGPLVRDAVRSAERRWTLDEGAPPVTLDVQAVPAVRGSGDEIRHALDHLLQNAREAGNGQTPITVRLRWDGAARVALEVADQGRGMDEPTRQRAGEPFFTTKGPGRLGVGLAVAQAAATRHRGDLQIDSAPGRGTTVRLRLPVAGDLVAAPPPPASGDGAPRRVLVVEDEKPVRDSMVEVLELQGYSVRAATSGPEASALLRRDPVDAVVADFALPSGSGLEVGRVAKEIRPGTPVVLVTAWPGRIDTETLERHGIDAVVEKPVGLETLCATLSTLLGRSPSRAG
jgi:signal transduction histidine kinase